MSCPMLSAKLQSPVHHSDFREDFQMLLAINNGEIVSTSYTWSHISTTMK